MKKIRTQKTNLKRQVLNQKSSILDVILESPVKTQVYAIQDPSERLIATIGASMFNEPKYYPTDSSCYVRNTSYCQDDIDANAQMIINTAIEIAESESPRDLLAIAHWARKELRLRTTPQVLLAVAAHVNNSKQFVRQYCPRIIQRADELKQVFLASRMLYGDKHSLPNSLKRGIADSFQKFGEYDFLKYEGSNRPYFSDILKMIDRRKGYPLPVALSDYLHTQTVTDPNATPLIAARKALAKLKDFSTEAKTLAKASAANWEVLVSQFGNTKEIWEHLIDNNSLPYMATLRNLRNIVLADVTQSHIDRISDKLIQGAVDSKQLPYRFIAAKKVLNDLEFTCTELQKYHIQCLEKALHKAVEKIVETIPSIPGISCIAIDNSGSMSSAVSNKSKMTLNEAATILGAIVFKKSNQQESVIGGFGDRWGQVISQHAIRSDPLNLAATVANLDVGHSTNAGAVIEWALAQNKKFDRIIIISDMQTYGEQVTWFNTGGKTLQELISIYRRQINPICKLHCIDLAGISGQSPTSQNDCHTNIVAGFSEQLLNTICEFEGLNKSSLDSDSNKQVFTLEYIRENY